MAKTKPFDKNTKLYEQWFTRNNAVYKSELKAIRHFIPGQGKGIEIGIGSGLFAKPLGIREGIDPSEEMIRLSEKRGLKVIKGVAEKLPFPDENYDYALMVTTICFVDDPEKALKEVYRILKGNGLFIIAFVDKESETGKDYLKNKEKSLFYKDAVFFSTGEIINLLNETGFKNLDIVQTVFGKLDKIETIQDFSSGFGKGSFIVIKAIK